VLDTCFRRNDQDWLNYQQEMALRHTSVKVSMRIPDCGPFGETLLEARTLAIVAAFFLNRPGGGCVESVVTDRTHLFLLRSARCCPPGMLNTTVDGTPPSAKIGILWPETSSSSGNVDRTEGSVALRFSDVVSCRLRFIIQQAQPHAEEVFSLKSNSRLEP
jgi:hypothetical protein